MEYRQQSMQPWIINDKEVGQIKSGGGLTFVRVYEAGHEVSLFNSYIYIHIRTIIPFLFIYA